MTLPIGTPEIESLTYNPLTTQEASTPVFTITCTSILVVLHASTVTWTKDCTPVPNDINHLQSQTLLDCDTGTYQSVLTVTGPYYGEYKCQQQRKCCQYRLYHHCSWYVTQ